MMIIILTDLRFASHIELHGFPDHAPPDEGRLAVPLRNTASLSSPSEGARRWTGCPGKHRLVDMRCLIWKVQQILDAHYLGGRVELAESAIKKLSEVYGQAQK
jgi:hypothetical protein